MALAAALLPLATFFLIPVAVLLIPVVPLVAVAGLAYQWRVRRSSATCRWQPSYRAALFVGETSPNGATLDDPRIAKVPKVVMWSNLGEAAVAAGIKPATAAGRR